MGLTKNLGWLSKYITADSAGKIGIGTATPNYGLNVVSSDITLSGIVSNRFIGIRKTSNTLPGYLGLLGGDNGDNAKIIGYNSAGTQTFEINASTSATYFNGGNVGIGITSPLRKLEVASDGSNWISGTFSGTGNTNKVVIGNLVTPTIGGHNAGLGAWSDFTIAGANINFSPYGSTAMRLFDNGNVFIGSSPVDSGYKLEVSGTGKFTGSGFGSNGIEAYGANGGSGISAVAGGSAGSAIYGTTGDASSFGGTFQNTTSGVALRVLGNSTISGNVGIGVTSPQAVFHNRGSFITQDAVFYGEKKSIFTQSVFNNPTVNLLTIGSTASYGAVLIRVTIYHNTISTGMSILSVGYANWAGNPYPTISKSVINPVIQASFNGAANVGTLAWSGNTLTYTSNRMTNYDGYTIIVEYGGNSDVNAFPVFG